MLNWILTLIVVGLLSAFGMILAEPKLAFRLSAWLYHWADATVKRRLAFAASMAEREELKPERAAGHSLCCPD